MNSRERERARDRERERKGESERDTIYSISRVEIDQALSRHVGCKCVHYSACDYAPACQIVLGTISDVDPDHHVHVHADILDFCDSATRSSMVSAYERWHED